MTIQLKYPSCALDVAQFGSVQRLGHLDREEAVSWYFQTMPHVQQHDALLGPSLYDEEAPSMSHVDCNGQG